MSINNSGDLPHCVTVKDVAKAVSAQALSTVNPLLNFVPQFNKMQQENMIAANPFKAYDQAPWTHVWLERPSVKNSDVTMGHGTMFDKLSEPVKFVYYVNGDHAGGMQSISEIVRERLFKEVYEVKN
ncbi:MAG: hypothetical protein GXY05_13860 [Clostridiales bacterium]|nr:hypothetical protein [Clostridiales bacterium]